MLEFGILLDSLKIAKIIPLYKKGNINSITNYQPISLLLFVVCLPRPMEGMGRLQFSDLFSQNCQFHHRRLESLEHLMCFIYILLSTTVSHFFDLTDAFFFLQGLLFLVYISILQVHFACVLCI